MRTSRAYAEMAEECLQTSEYKHAGAIASAQVWATLAQAAAVRELRETLEAEAERRDLLRARE